MMTLKFRHGLPAEYDEFDYTLLGERLFTDYSMGYTFFRIREEQLGKDIYKRMLEKGNIGFLAPIPGK